MYCKGDYETQKKWIELNAEQKQNGKKNERILKERGGDKVIWVWIK